MENFYNKKDQRLRMDNELSIDRAKSNEKLIDDL